MENMQYAEELLREFLVFRGFTSTLQAFEKELSSDIGKGFQVDKILDLIFSVYVPKFQADKLVGLLCFFNQCISSSCEEVLVNTLSKLEVSVLRYYIIHALKSGKQEKVIEFFEANGNDLLQKHEDWTPWFAIPYIKNPNLHPQFRVYFSKEWYNALHLSFRNFLGEIFNGTRIPSLLKISTEKNTVKHLKNDIRQLNLKLSELQALLEDREAELTRLKSMESSALLKLPKRGDSLQSGAFLEGRTHVLPPDDSLESDGAMQSTIVEESNPPKEIRKVLVSDSSESFQSASWSNPPKEDENEEVIQEEEFPEVKVDFQESFLGHTSPISRCRFSASGNNIASASVDGTVRIWTYDTSASTLKNATIYCGAEIMSLDWECRYDRLLLIGTADGAIKAWNVDAKRVVCDLYTTADYPSVLDLKCSPVDPIFVSAAASKRPGSNHNDNLGFASLTVWNMKMWKAMFFHLAKIHRQLLLFVLTTMGRY